MPVWNDGPWLLALKRLRLWVNRNIPARGLPVLRAGNDRLPIAPALDVTVCVPRPFPIMIVPIIMKAELEDHQAQKRCEAVNGSPASIVDKLQPAPGQPTTLTVEIDVAPPVTIGASINVNERLARNTLDPRKISIRPRS
jgi:hypothetical protein